IRPLRFHAGGRDESDTTPAVEKLEIQNAKPDGRGRSPATRIPDTARTNAGCGPTRFVSAWCFLGSTGLSCKLANSGSLSSILTDVAADMLNLRNTRVTRSATVKCETPIGCVATITRNAPTVPVVRASSQNGRRRPCYDSSAIMSRVAAATASSQRSGPNWLRYGSRV
ncbi:MAG: hypothetical protein DWI21_09430, partial [Planctomycetota bacterium]